MPVFPPAQNKREFYFNEDAQSIDTDIKICILYKSNSTNNDLKEVRLLKLIWTVMISREKKLAL